MTPLDTPAHSAPLSDAQTSLLDDVVRQARLSDQHTSRTRLRDAMPSLTSVFNEDDDAAQGQGNNWDPDRTENRDRWLSVIWPKDRLISELDEEYVDDEHEEVKIFEFEDERFERNPSVSMDLVDLRIQHREFQTSEGEPYEVDGELCRDEYTDTSAHHLIVLSRMAAVVVKSDYGDYCDEDFDASAYGTVYLSENPHQMLALLRSRVAEFPAQALEGKDVEAELSRVFGRDYAPPTPGGLKKGLRP